MRRAGEVLQHQGAGKRKGGPSYGRRTLCYRVVTGMCPLCTDNSCASGMGGVAAWRDAETGFAFKCGDCADQCQAEDLAVWAGT